MQIESNMLEVDQEKEEAKMLILSIRDEVAVMGFNDYEIPTLDQIVENLENGLVAPKDAIEAAYKIKANKQDYH